MKDITIKSNGDANAQVTQKVKNRLYNYLEQFGVDSCRDGIHFHHYKDGKYVAVSVHDTIEIQRYNEFRQEVLTDERNKNINDNTVWLHRDWISEVLF